MYKRMLATITVALGLVGCNPDEEPLDFQKLQGVWEFHNESLSPRDSVFWSFEGDRLVIYNQDNSSGPNGGDVCIYRKTAHNFSVFVTGQVEFSPVYEEDSPYVPEETYKYQFTQISDFDVKGYTLSFESSTRPKGGEQHSKRTWIDENTLEVEEEGYKSYLWNPSSPKRDGYVGYYLTLKRQDVDSEFIISKANVFGETMINDDGELTQQGTDIIEEIKSFYYKASRDISLTRHNGSVDDFVLCN